MTIRNSIAAVAVAAALSAAGAAGAQGYFISQDALEVEKTFAKIDTVTVPEDGVIAVYDYSGADYGELLGTETVTEGINTNLRISFNPPAIGRVVMIYYAGEIGDPASAAGWMEVDTDDGRILPASD